MSHMTNIIKKEVRELLTPGSVSRAVPTCLHRVRSYWSFIPGAAI